jgi:STE24 endopeptidase
LRLVSAILSSLIDSNADVCVDAFSHSLGYAQSLASSLIKLQIQNLSSMDADWMYSSYHYSHPILTERLKAVGWKGETKVGTGQANGKVEGKSEL